MKVNIKKGNILLGFLISSGSLLFINCIVESQPYYKAKDFTRSLLSSWTKSQKRENFSLIILTRDRPYSLLRLLNSLLKTKFNDASINLIIHIDGSIDMNESYHEALKFNWPFGEKSIKKYSKQKGLAMAWFNAWYPKNSFDLGIIFEDDIIVSPWWYKWLKNAWKLYLNRNDIAGITLQRQSLIPTVPHKKREIINNNEPFLYALVGSIGFSPHPVQWKKFIDWIHKIDLDTFNVSIPGLVTSKWYKKGKMWTQHFIYFCKYYQLYTLYVNLPQKRSLAEHYQEKGVHFQKTLGPIHKVAENISLIFPKHLNKYTFAGTLETKAD